MTKLFNNHTALPWDLNAYNMAQIIKIHDGPDAQGRTYKDDRHQVVLGNFPTINMNWKDDAAFAVHATKHHYTLLEILQEMVNTMTTPQGSMSSTDYEDMRFKALQKSRQKIKEVRNEQ